MNQSTPKMEQDVIEIDFGKLFRYYLHHWKALVCSGLAAALLAFAVTYFFITPLYQASVTIYVNNSVANSQVVTEISNQSLATAQRLVSTYVNIIRSDTVLTEVIEKGRLDCTVVEIRKAMKAKQVENTEMFTVSISHEDPDMAADIANAIAKVAPTRISSFVEGSSTKIVDYAKVPRAPYTPSYPRNVAFGLLIGLVLMGLLLTFQYVFDMRLTEEDDINSYFTEPVLGTIPEFSAFENKKGEGR